MNLWIICELLREAALLKQDGGLGGPLFENCVYSTERVYNGGGGKVFIQSFYHSQSLDLCRMQRQN